MISPTISHITGSNKEHLILDESLNRYFHKDAYQDFLNLKNLALELGHDIYVLSSFRSFEDQLRIWNMKASGKRDILSTDGEKLNLHELSPKETVFSILRWSALPGASRHHWGSDIDVICKKSCPKDYDVQLIPWEYEKDGPFYKLRLFLDDEFSKEDSKFFRPYQNDLGGVAPEMWHISHKKVSKRFLENLSFDSFKNFYENKDKNEFLLLDTVLNNLEEIYESFVTNICD